MGNRHHLRYEEEYALNGWLLANKARLEELTKEQQLVVANKELSFPVTQTQLTKRRQKHKIKCAIQRTYGPPKAGNGVEEPKKIGLRDLAAAINGMGEAVAVLVKYQALIFDQLGVKYGEDLSGLVKRIEDHERAVQ